MLRRCVQQGWMLHEQLCVGPLRHEIGQWVPCGSMGFSCAGLRMSSSSSCIVPAWVEGGKGLGVVKEISDLSADFSGLTGPMTTKFQVRYAVLQLESLLLRCKG